MLASDPRPNHAPRPVDCADSDPATWRMRAGVPLNGPAPKPPATQAFLDKPPEGAETGFFGWFRKAEQRTQVAAEGAVGNRAVLGPAPGKKQRRAHWNGRGLDLGGIAASMVTTTCDTVMARRAIQRCCV